MQTDNDLPTQMEMNRLAVSDLSSQQMDVSTTTLISHWDDSESDLSTQQTDVATSALMNPLLLNLIFSYMDAPTLKKSVRPVCTLWADLGAPFLGGKTTQTYSEQLGCGMYTPEITGVASFHSKLVRNVKLVASTCPCEWSERLPENFVAVLPNIARHLEEIEVKIGSSFLHGLHKMWESHRFTNLARISITVLSSYDENGRWILAGSSYPTMGNVTMISVIMGDQYNPNTDGMAASICQKLLNAAPNLVEVEVKANFYLDFAPCKKLTRLTYKFVQFVDFATHEPTEVMDLGKIAEMLTPCRDSLAELSLYYVGPDGGHDDDVPQTLSLPSFPNLTRLTISCMDGYFRHLGDCLYTTHLPALTHVKLAASDKESLTLTLPEMFEHFRQPHVGIVSLDVDAAYDGEAENVAAAAVMVRLFPAVTKLQLKLTISEDLNSVALRRLKETLRNLAPWELTSALVEVQNVKSSGVVLATMQGLARWKGLAHTEVRLCGKVGAVLVPGDAVKAILLTCREVKLVKMSGFLIKGRDKFQGFIDANRLPITLSE